MKLDSNEAKQLESLSQDAGLDKGIGKRTETQPLEVTPVKQREGCSLKHDPRVSPSRWNA